MASLLDFVVAQRNPRLAGLLGTGGPEAGGQQAAPQAAPAPQAGPAPAQAGPLGGGGQGPGGIAGVLSQLFGGTPDPRLSAAANAQARKQAMITGGLASFGSDKRGLGRLADIALTGQTIGSQIREQQVQAKKERLALQRRAEQEQEMAAALEANDTDQLQTLQGELAIQGNKEAAATIGSILESKGVGAKAIQVDMNNGRTAMVNPVTNQAEAVFGVPDDQEVERSDLGDRVVYHVKGEPDNILAVEQKGVSPNKEAQLAFERQQEARRRALEESGVITDEQSSLMNTLADDIRMDAKDSQFVADAARTLNNMPDNAASDLSLVSSYTRITDPGASVRQSDVENATNIGGLSAGAQQWINFLAEEGQFSDPQRKLIKDEALRIARERAEAWQGRLEKFKNRARLQGLPPEAINTVAIDPFAGLELGVGSGDMFGDLGEGR